MSKPDLSSPDGFISALSDLGPMRVWSVIITIFGDLVRPRGGVVSAAALNAIGARLGIRPEAMRVALFRLVKDGWIERRKEGRNSFYVLTQNGSRKFLPATQRIYAHSPALRRAWTLVSFDSAPQADVTQKLEEDGFFAISSQIYLGSVGSGLEPDTALIMSGEVRIFPAWAKAKLGPGELAAEFRKLNHRLQQLEQGWALARASHQASSLVAHPDGATRADAIGGSSKPASRPRPMRWPAQEPSLVRAAVTGGSACEIRQQVCLGQVWLLPRPENSRPRLT